MKKLNFKNLSNNFKLSNSSLTKYNFTSSTSNEINPSNINLNLKFTDLRNITLSLSSNSNLKDLENEIKKYKNVENIEFRTWDSSKISSYSSLESILLNSNEPIFVKLDKLEWQELKRKDITNTINLANYNDEETSYEEKKRIIGNLKLISKNKELTEADFEDIEENISKIRHFYNNSVDEKLINRDSLIVDNKNVNNVSNKLNISNLFEKYYSLKEEYSNLINLENKLIRSSEKKALIVILLGGILFILELIALYYGTFVYYSWDITEPITYLVTCGNLVLILLLKRKFGTLTAHEYFARLFLRKKFKKLKFDKNHLLNLRTEIKDIERKLI